MLTVTGLALDLVDRDLRRAPAMFYYQTNIHIRLV
ncbi:GntR family transcriptional regulator [Cutibacterium acnes]|nr:GntR family transcriptional regulator [Cutibacterium acnes]